ncbi:hypothetical protein Gasu2_24620 [Galdieria sulphuraria]|uniref:Uncharacterized protein n=1 Tax=Galdieria sulphuraria TaxID=130081 RepID=M2W575_GALSU|nr:uncharacterized protein Gasu_19140 [Galdieria sulphuraria]EME30901.1 hypothetical protein Gasu_19140 [Galdieria sulphuraria]GJD08154.1 hypothetical protein Gasu2_24620 [Galdieria sulphuraria]|eukprot:XP_005707421.1 hypothetical protein Gasu_19140 [Galdieria sulphuraria]
MQKNKRAKLEKYEKTRHSFDSKREQIIRELSKSAETSQITSKRISAFPVTFVETDQNYFSDNHDRQRLTQKNELREEINETLTNVSAFTDKHNGNFSNQDSEGSEDPNESVSEDKKNTLEKVDQEDLPQDIFDDTLLDEELVRFF